MFFKGISIDHSSEILESFTDTHYIRIYEIFIETEFNPKSPS